MAYALLFFASLFWGGSFVATRFALTCGGLTVFLLLSLRFFISTLILTFIVLITKRESLNRRDVLRLLSISIIYPALYFILETTGIKRTPAFLSSLIISSIPVLTGLIARIFLNEKLSLRGWLGIFISIGGIVLILIGDRGRIGVGRMSFSILGVLLMFGAAVTGSIYTTATKYLVTRYSPLTLTTFQSAFAFVFFTVLASIATWSKGANFNMIFNSITPEGIVAILFLGIFASVLAFLFYTKALAVMEAGKVSLFLNTIPVISLISAWLLLGESIYVTQIPGFLTVIVGVFIASWKKGGKGELFIEEG